MIPDFSQSRYPPNSNHFDTNQTQTEPRMLSPGLGLFSENLCFRASVLSYSTSFISSGRFGTMHRNSNDSSPSVRYQCGTPAGM